MKMIITFPQMEAKLAEKRAKMTCRADGSTDWAKFEADLDATAAERVACLTEGNKAMDVLEETAFALAMERMRRETGKAGFMSDHIGLFADYSVDKHGYVIDGDLLYPGLIDALESLQKLGAFTMRFESRGGKAIPDGWWRPTDDDDFDIWDETDYSQIDSYMAEKIRNAELAAVKTA